LELDFFHFAPFDPENYGGFENLSFSSTPSSAIREKQKQKLITKSSKKKVQDHSNEFFDVFFWLAILGVFGNSVNYSEEF
jgi:hypothetical protein